MPSIVVVEDHKQVADMLAAYLAQEGFTVAVARDGASGLTEVKRRLPDLVVLDLALPDVPGLDVCRGIRLAPETATIPIIILTAKGAESDRVVGLELGADDYVVKPFSARELVARIRAVLRRPRGTGPKEVLVRGELRVDLSAVRATVGNATLSLTPTQFRILAGLARHPGVAMSRKELVEVGSGLDATIDERNVDSQVSRLRAVLESAAPGRTWIETVRGRGYRFAE